MSERAAYGHDLPASLGDLQQDDFASFDASLGWIEDGFKITKGQVPRLLAIRKVLGIADLYQDGWSQGVPLNITVVTPASTTGFMFGLLSQQTTGGGSSVPGVTFANALPTGLSIAKGDVNLATNMVRVLGFDADHTGGASAGVVRVRLKLGRTGDPSTSPFPRLVNGSVPAGGSLDHAGFFGAQQNLWIPPGWDWVIEVPTTVGAEGYIFHIALLMLPKGVKVQS